MYSSLSRLLYFTLTAQLSLSVASPVTDNPAVEVRREYVRSPLHLARRHAEGYQPRHLRPEEFVVYEPAATPVAKRDDISPPGVGQIATFTSSYPEPTRLGLGFEFLSNSNHEIDQQNIDNVAGPTTDQGNSSRS